MRVKGNADMCGLLFCEDLIQRIQEAHNGTGIQPFGVDSGVFDERIITAINERISV
jgi:hypothetical protein